MQIQDGIGRGYRTEVDYYNRLHCHCTSITEIGDVSVRTERAYSVTTDNLTFTSTNEHPWLWMKNTNPNLTFFFSSIIYSYNGGNTNYNRSLIKRVYRNPPTPTGRYEEGSAYNLNFGSNKTAQLTVYKWDGTGDGMEIDLSNTDNFSTSTVQKGTLTLSDIEGVVVPYNSTVLFTYEPEEIGKASISIKFFYNHEEIRS